MTHDIHALMLWIRWAAFIAALCTTSVPIMYSFFPWRSRLIGRAFMLQAVSFALLMDITMLGVVWHPTNILVIFWIDAIVISLIAISTSTITYLMWRANHPKKRGTPNALQ